MQAVQRHAADGGPVLGICNGFQILCEAHLLPGALMRNAGLTFVSKPVRPDGRAHRHRVHLRVRDRRPGRAAGRARRGPLRGADDTLRMLEAEGRVVLRYVAATEGSPLQPNPNGSANAHRRHLQRRRQRRRHHAPSRARRRPMLGLADGLGFFTLHGCVGSRIFHLQNVPKR